MLSIKRAITKFKMNSLQKFKQLLNKILKMSKVNNNNNNCSRNRNRYNNRNRSRNKNRNRNRNMNKRSSLKVLKTQLNNNKNNWFNKVI